MKPIYFADKNKLKRVRVYDCIKDRLDEELEGPIVEVYEKLQKVQMGATLKGWKDIVVVKDGDYDDAWHELHGTRKETDAEMRRRFAKIRKYRAKNPKKKK